VAVVGADAACELLYAKHKRELSEKEQQLFITDKMREYENKVMNVQRAVMAGYVDRIIEPDKTREILIKDIMSIGIKKRVKNVHKKHGNIPC